MMVGFAGCEVRLLQKFFTCSEPVETSASSFHDACHLWLKQMYLEEPHDSDPGHAHPRGYKWFN